MEHCGRMGAQRQNGTNWPLVVTLGIALAVSLRVWSLWSQLPDTMASHFGLSGRADSYMSKEGFFLVVALVGGGALAAVFASPILMRRLPPGLVNLPNRHYWLANDERREIAIQRVTDLLGGMGVATAALLAVAIELVMQANLHRTHFDNRTFVIVMVAYLGFAVYVFIQKMRLLKVPGDPGS
ncbi:MAG: DUF1648 domain-containing protein [Deltaproteobacteria bacterium]|nr:DUF1648 domain-containing protein [Deltaproteobacteria bacterium]